MATVRTPDRARPAVRQTVLALVFAVLVALLLLGTVVGQASPPTQAGAYWPCPPRTHWECNE